MQSITCPRWKSTMSLRSWEIHSKCRLNKARCNKERWWKGNKWSWIKWQMKIQITKKLMIWHNMNRILKYRKMMRIKDTITTQTKTNNGILKSTSNLWITEINLKICLINGRIINKLIRFSKIWATNRKITCNQCKSIIYMEVVRMVTIFPNTHQQMSKT